MKSNSTKTDHLLELAGQGERRVLDDLFSRHTARLERMIQVRLDRRLRSRIDVADVLQEAYLEAARRFEDYLRRPRLPFYLWLRSIAAQEIINLHRVHLAAKARDKRREVPLDPGGLAPADSKTLAATIISKHAGASDAVLRAELRVRLEKALDELSAMDREILVLRSFEQLTSAEAAQVFGLEEGTVRKRYFRALKKLKEIILRMPGGIEWL